MAGRTATGGRVSEAASGFETADFFPPSGWRVAPVQDAMGLRDLETERACAVARHGRPACLRNGRVPGARPLYFCVYVYVGMRVVTFGSPTPFTRTGTLAPWLPVNATHRTTRSRGRAATGCPPRGDIAHANAAVPRIRRPGSGRHEPPGRSRGPASRRYGGEAS